MQMEQDCIGSPEIPKCDICDSIDAVEIVQLFSQSPTRRCKKCREANKATFPKTIGWYWFYGWPSSFDKDFDDAFSGKKELYVVQVKKVGSRLLYFCNGQRMSEFDGAEGVFEKIKSPTFDIS